MRTLLLILTFAGSCCLMGCKDENFDPNQEPLKGKIGGNDWAYTGGSALQSGPGLISGLILSGTSTDPCATVVTINPHISFAFPAVRGNYNIGVPSDNVTVIFSLQGGTTKYTASSGFVDIVYIGSTEVIGYLSADFDENNSVQGSFGLNFCN